MDKFFEYEGVLWEKIVDDMYTLDFAGPYCRREDCRYSLQHISGQYNETKVKCPHCGKEYRLSRDPVLLRYDVATAYEAAERQGVAVERLGKRPAEAKQSVKIGDFWIRTVVREEAGKPNAYIYIGKITDGQQVSQKTQLIVDIADEELRHDGSDLFPGEILAEVNVKFKNSESSRSYKDAKK